jgi:hypothetical protein
MARLTRGSLWGRNFLIVLVIIILCTVLLFDSKFPYWKLLNCYFLCSQIGAGAVSSRGWALYWLEASFQKKEVYITKPRIVDAKIPTSLHIWVFLLRNFFVHCSKNNWIWCVSEIWWIPRSSALPRSPLWANNVPLQNMSAPLTLALRVVLSLRWNLLKTKRLDIVTELTGSQSFDNYDCYIYFVKRFI